MADFTAAQAKKMLKFSASWRAFAKKYGVGAYRFLENVDATTGAITATMGSAVTGTTNADWTVDSDNTSDVKLKLATNTSADGNYTLTIQPKTATWAANRTLSIPDPGGSDEFVLLALAQTLTNKTLTTPTIADFTNATHDHSDNANGGTIASLPSITGTNSASFTVDDDSSAAKIKLDTNSATGDYTLSLVPTNLTGNRTVTFPDATCTLAGIGEDNTWTGTNDFQGDLSASTGDPSIDFSGSTGAFKTSTGAVTLGGNVTVSGSKTFTTGTGNVTVKGDMSIDAGKDFDMSDGAGTFATGTGAVSIKGDTTISAGKDLNFASGAGYIQMNGATAGALKIGPFDDLSYTVTLAVADQTGAATLTIPDLGGAASSIVLTGASNTFTAEQTVAIEDANNTSVTDLLTLKHTTSGSPGAGIGAGISVIVENDTDATTEVANIDFVTTSDGEKVSLDTDVSIKTMLGGECCQAMLIDASAQEVVFGRNSSDADGINAIRIYPNTTASRGSLVLKAQTHASADYATTLQSATNLGAAATLTLPNATATISGIGLAETFSGVKTFSAAPVVQDDVKVAFGTGSDAAIQWQTNDANAECLAIILGDDAGNVVPALVIGDSSVEADLGDWNAATQPTVALYDSDADSYLAFDWSADDVARIAVGGSATALGITANTTVTGTLGTTGAITITKDDTSDGVVDVLTLKHTSSDNDPTANDGVGISFHLENDDNTSGEEVASIDVVETNISSGTEDADIVVSAMMSGSVAEAMRLDASDNSLTLGVTGTSTIDKLRIYGDGDSKGSVILECVDNGGDYDVTIKNAVFGQSSTLTIPDPGDSADTFVLLDATQTLTNKTLTSPAITGATITIAAGIDTATAVGMTVGAATCTGLTLGASDITTAIAGDATIKGDLDTGSAAAMTIGAANATSVAVGASDITTTLNGVVQGDAEGYMTHTLVVDATIAEINTGHTLVTCPAGRQLQLVDVKAIAYGGAMGGCTTVDIIEETSGDKLCTFAVGDLAQSAILSMEEDGTVLADGASFTAQTADKDIQASKTGAACTTATGVRFIISYLIV